MNIDDTYRAVEDKYRGNVPCPQVIIRAPISMGQRTWGDELLVAQGPGYIGKVLLMKAGEAGGLQRHAQKDETSYLYKGKAVLTTDLGDGTLSEVLLVAGTSIHIPPGAVHQVRAVTDCVFFEASTPHFNDRERMEAQYGLPDTGGLPSTR